MLYRSPGLSRLHLVCLPSLHYTAGSKAHPDKRPAQQVTADEVGDKEGKIGLLLSCGKKVGALMLLPRKVFGGNATHF